MSYKVFYHITPIENIESIKENGLKTNEDGKVFLFKGCDICHPFCRIKRDRTFKIENHWVPNDRLIATNQLFLRKYAVFAVMLDENETAQLEKDEVAEKTAGDQYIYRNDIPKSKVWVWKTVEIKTTQSWNIWNKKYVLEHNF